ncbi:unnamed protein product [Prunus armeniaca]|uniref:Uncharacterized protein n=1 Tax=Prunus armeniaca TaxID=36596 RepID=A0A6J5WIA2_PRUAR|nr:unnamed protein product [Prunus armeniaca]
MICRYSYKFLRLYLYYPRSEGRQTSSLFYLRFQFIACSLVSGLEYFLFVDPHQEVSIYTRWQRCKSDLNMKQLMELYAELEKLEKLYSFCQNLNC